MALPMISNYYVIPSMENVVGISLLFVRIDFRYSASLTKISENHAISDPDGDQWPPMYSTGSKQLSIVAVS